MLLASVEQGCSGLIEQVTELRDGEIFGRIVRAPVQQFDSCGVARLPLGHRQCACILVLKCLKKTVDDSIGGTRDICIIVVVD